MSRIQKLIERARQERSSNLGAAGLATGRVGAAAAAPATAVPASPPPAAAGAGLDWARLSRCDLREGDATRGRILLDQINAAGASAYKMLRTRVLQRMRSNGWQSIAISSLMPGEGKSLTAINLACSIARDPSAQCTLVELDLRSPSMAEYLRLEATAGVDDYLQGRAALSDVVLATSLEGLFLSPVMNHQQYSSELLATDAARKMVATLKAPPSMIVIYDLPPILQADDLLAFAPLIDAVLLVVAEGQTNRDELAQARDIFEELNLLGVVLNKSGDQVDQYGY